MIGIVWPIILAGQDRDQNSSLASLASNWHVLIDDITTYTNLIRYLPALINFVQRNMSCSQIESIFNNQGLSHIPESILSFLDYESILSSRSVCHSIKRNIDKIRFWWIIKNVQEIPLKYQNEWQDLKKYSEVSNRFLECYLLQKYVLVVTIAKFLGYHFRRKCCIMFDENLWTIYVI